MSQVVDFAAFRQRRAEAEAVAPAEPVAAGVEPVPTDVRRYAMHFNAGLRAAMLNIVRDVAEHGLVDSTQAVYVTFRTHHPGVSLPPHVAADFPEECMIVLQYEYGDLEVTDWGIRVTLHFGGEPWRVEIPAELLIMIGDPSVNFGVAMVNQQIFQQPRSA